VIEPLIVYPQKGKGGHYHILDGHLRFYALKQLGKTETLCLVAKDDEAFTYNHQINRLSPIQEHLMISKAVKNGVTPARIAAALNIEEQKVQFLLNLLEGIHPEAAEILKDKHMAPQAVYMLRKVVPLRQIEMAELMVNMNNYTVAYVKALLVGTAKSQLLAPEAPKKVKGLSTEDIAKMEEEMHGLEESFRHTQDSYSENVMHLTVIKAYLKRLLDNARIVRHLASKHPDVLQEFQTITSLEAL